MVNRILNVKIGDRPVFTWSSLLNYIVRLDMYQAIPRMEAMHILTDYLHMCGQLEMEPRIDSDSLKREHDVCARLLRQKRDEIRARRMQHACDRNQTLNYAEHTFMARAISDYDDLMDEARQQHNCVVGYADRIACGHSRIFVVREVAHPEKSLATVEVNSSGNVVQKLLAYNQPIRNEALTSFIKRFEKHVKEVMRREETECVTSGDEVECEVA